MAEEAKSRKFIVRATPLTVEFTRHPGSNFDADDPERLNVNIRRGGDCVCSPFNIERGEAFVTCSRLTDEENNRVAALIALEWFAWPATQHPPEIIVSDETLVHSLKAALGAVEAPHAG